jgi:hypothetical protein
LCGIKEKQINQENDSKKTNRNQKNEDQIWKQIKKIKWLWMKSKIKSN